MASEHKGKLFGWTAGAIIGIAVIAVVAVSAFAWIKTKLPKLPGTGSTTPPAA